MANLGEELQARIKQSLETEIAFYANRGLINSKELCLISNIFEEATKAASTTLPLELAQRPMTITTPKEIQDRSLSSKIEEAMENVMVKLGIKATFDESPWNGDASQWKTPEAYCASCLIDMNEGGGPKIKDKCKLPYKKPGSSAINKGALRAMAGGRGLPAVKGVPKDQVVKAANWMISHWQSAFDKPAPANIYRLAGKNPPEGVAKESSAKFFKDKSGQWWMLGIYSNRWMDREHEILSEFAHKEYADWVNKTGFKPQVVVYHLPKMPDGFWEKVWGKWSDNVEKLNEITRKVYQKTSLGEVERIVPLNGFSVAVSKIYPAKYEQAEKLAAMQDVGMSHGFLVLDELDPDSFSSTKDTVNIIERYRSFEVSVLLRKRAANYGTAPIFVEGKSVTYSDEDRKMMAALLPPDVMEALDENTKEAADVLDTMLEHKELTDSGEVIPEIKEETVAKAKEEEKPTPPVETEPAVVDEKAKAPPVPDEDEEDTEEGSGEDMEENKGKKPAEEKVVAVPNEAGTNEDKVVETVMKVLNVEQLQAMLTAIVENQKSMAAEIAELRTAKESVVEEVKILKQTEDEKIAAKLSPVNWGGVGYSPASTKETAIPKEEADRKLAEGPKASEGFTLGDNVADLFLNSIVNGRKS